MEKESAILTRFLKTNVQNFPICPLRQSDNEIYIYIEQNNISLRNHMLGIALTDDVGLDLRVINVTPAYISI